MEQLDYREKGGYVQRIVEMHSLDSSSTAPIRAVAYIGTSDSEDWAGGNEAEAGTVENIADIVVRSHGPSGPNIDYVLNLATAMRRIAPQHADPHLEQLEAAVLERLGPDKGGQALEAAKVAVQQAGLEMALHQKAAVGHGRQAGEVPVVEPEELESS